MRIRYSFVLAAMALATAAPAARAQEEPPRTNEIKEAEKFIASAMTSTDTTEKRTRYERALNPVQQAIAKNPENARVWLTAGEVYSALHDYSHADSAFTKAAQLYPKFAEDVKSDRITAWADAFSAGATLMDAGKYDEALAVFEAAEKMYSERPEAKMNIGAIYANKGDVAKAMKAFSDAVAIVEGPQKDQLKPEEAAQWKRFDVLAHLNMAQMQGQLGITAFGDQKYDDAIAAFKKAHEMNPVARDYSYNLSQSLYAKANALEETRGRLQDDRTAAQTKKDVATAKAKADSIAAVGAQINAVYGEMEPLIATSREYDPNNEDLFLLLARSDRIRADIASDAATKASLSRKVEDVLKQHDAMSVEVSNISINTNANNESAVSGKIKNRKLAAGTPVKIHFALLGVDGAPVGEQDVTVNAPAADAVASFEANIKATGDIAGWKYTIAQ